MSAKQWIEKTHTKGIIAKAGRYGGTYAYKDIALELLQNNGVIRILTHTDKKGNIRDYANINELICLSNMENINTLLIEDGLSQPDRLIKLNKIAIHQMAILEELEHKILK